jgi:hypothetical protein
MSNSIGARQMLALGGIGALCVSALGACTGLVSGNGSDFSTNPAGSGSGSTTSSAGTGASVSAAAGTGGGAPAIDPGSMLIHRLNTAEYNNTVGDVLGTTLRPGSDLWAAEETAGYDNIAAVQGVDQKQYKLYYDAAGVVAKDVFSNPTLKARIVTCSTDDAACVKGVIAATGLRLFRRPLSDDELGTYQKVYSSLRAGSLSADDSLQQVLVALLASAEFLFRMEFDPTPDSSTPHPLSGYELATRLSYFLWQSAPDEALLQAAQSGELLNDTKLSSETTRLTTDPKSARFSRSFVGQWLGIRNVVSHHVDEKAFPNWVPELGMAMAEEVYSFFDEFRKGARPWPEFVSADVNYVDKNLATLYGVSAPASGMVRIENKDDHRQGFLGMGAFLTLSSMDYRTEPTLRGRHVLLDLLCTKFPDPPPGIKKLDVDGATVDASQQNVRARLKAHRVEVTCNVCHGPLDPYGLALENFDAIGQYRTSYGEGSPIDASTELPDGTRFSGLSGVIADVQRHPELNTCIASNLLTYGLGRELTDADKPYLNLVAQRWASDALTLPRLIESLVLADTFRKRHGG